MLTQRVCDARLLFDGARTQRRSGYRKPPHHHGQKVEIGDLASLKESYLHQSPFIRQQTYILLDVWSANHVENNVDAALPSDPFHLSDKIVGSVIDDVVGTQITTELRFFFTTHGRENDGPKLLCDLDRGYTLSRSNHHGSRLFRPLEAGRD